MMKQEILEYVSNSCTFRSHCVWKHLVFISAWLNNAVDKSSICAKLEKLKPENQTDIIIDVSCIVIFS